MQLSETVAARIPWPMQTCCSMVIQTPLDQLAFLCAAWVRPHKLHPWLQRLHPTPTHPARSAGSRSRCAAPGDPAASRTTWEDHCCASCQVARSGTVSCCTSAQNPVHPVFPTSPERELPLRANTLQAIGVPCVVTFPFQPCLTFANRLYETGARSDYKPPPMVFFVLP